MAETRPKVRNNLKVDRIQAPYGKRVAPAVNNGHFGYNMPWDRIWASQDTLDPPWHAQMTHPDHPGYTPGRHGVPGTLAGMQHGPRMSPGAQIPPIPVR